MSRDRNKRTVLMTRARMFTDLSFDLYVSVAVSSCKNELLVLRQCLLGVCGLWWPERYSGNNSGYSGYFIKYLWRFDVTRLEKKRTCDVTSWISLAAASQTRLGWTSFVECDSPRPLLTVLILMQTA